MPNVKTLKTSLSKIMLVLPLIFVLLFSFRQTPKESDIELNYNDELVNIKDGIKLSEIVDPEVRSELRFTFKKEVVEKMDSRFSEMQLTLVRDGKGIKSGRFNELLEKIPKDIHKYVQFAKPGDHFVIEWKLKGIDLSYSPKFMSIKIVE